MSSLPPALTLGPALDLLTLGLMPAPTLGPVLKPTPALKLALPPELGACSGSGDSSVHSNGSGEFNEMPDSLDADVSVCQVIMQMQNTELL